MTERCDLCAENGIESAAVVDARTPSGMWANVCGAHAYRLGVRLLDEAIEAAGRHKEAVDSALANAEAYANANKKPGDDVPDLVFRVAGGMVDNVIADMRRIRAKADR